MRIWFAAQSILHTLCTVISCFRACARHLFFLMCAGRPAGSRGKKATVAKNSGKQQPRKKPAKQAAEKPDKAAADGEQQQDSKPDTAAAKKKQKGTAALSDGAKRKRHRS